MINLYEKEDFSRTVFYIDGAEIKTGNLGDLCRAHSDEIPTPDGIGPRMHLRGCELWRWDAGGNARLVAAFETDEEAKNALFLCWRADLCESLLIFYDRKNAESSLRLELQDKRDELADEVERISTLPTNNVDDERRAFADLERAREELAEFDASPEGQALAQLNGVKS